MCVCVPHIKVPSMVCSNISILPYISVPIRVLIRVPLPSSTPLISTLTSVSISFPPSSWSSSESPFTSQSPPVFCLHLSPPYITVSISFRVPLMSKRSPLEPPLTSVSFYISAAPYIRVFYSPLHQGLHYNLPIHQSPQQSDPPGIGRGGIDVGEKPRPQTGVKTP